MESALYGIYALVFVSEILLVRCAHSFDFWYVNNSCVNTVRQHFPWSILYVRYVWTTGVCYLLGLIFAIKSIKTHQPQSAPPPPAPSPPNNFVTRRVDTGP